MVAWSMTTTLPNVVAEVCVPWKVAAAGGTNSISLLVLEACEPVIPFDDAKLSNDVGVDELLALGASRPPTLFVKATLSSDMPSSMMLSVSKLVLYAFDLV